ncbi:MAG: hypothetical protein AAF773_01530 [Cyanobacteria bacterium P01_D01_bin.115]
MDSIVGIVSLIFGILSFGFAVYQWSEVNNLKRYRIGKLRSDLRTCNAIVSNLYRVLIKLNSDDTPKTNYERRIYAAHSKSRVLVRSILQELSEIDTPYDEKRLEQYVKAGLIESQWLWRQALIFMRDAKPNIKIPNLPEETPDWILKGSDESSE